MQRSKRTQGLIWAFHAGGVILSIPFSLAVFLLTLLFILNLFDYPWNSAMYPSFWAMFSEAGSWTLVLGALTSFFWGMYHGLRKKRQEKDACMLLMGILMLLSIVV